MLYRFHLEEEVLLPLHLVVRPLQKLPQRPRKRRRRKRKRNPTTTWALDCSINSAMW
jgi:hypothetical protein